MGTEERGGCYRPGWLAPLAGLALLAVPASCGLSLTNPRSVVGSAFARTEAAGSADFQLMVSEQPGPTGPAMTQVFSGVVDFKNQILSETGRTLGKKTEPPGSCGSSCGSSTLTIEVASATSPGWATQYYQVPKGLAWCYGDGVYWEATTTYFTPAGSMGLELRGLANPANAIRTGIARLGGGPVTEYEVPVPAGMISPGIRYAAYADYVWVDAKGRAVREAQSYKETGALGFGHGGSLSLSRTITFSGFGKPVRVRVPRGYGRFGFDCPAPRPART